MTDMLVGLRINIKIYNIETIYILYVAVHVICRFKINGVWMLSTIIGARTFFKL